MMIEWKPHVTSLNENFSLHLCTPHTGTAMILALMESNPDYRTIINIPLRFTGVFSRPVRACPVSMCLCITLDNCTLQISQTCRLHWLLDRVRSFHLALRTAASSATCIDQVLRTSSTLEMTVSRQQCLHPPLGAATGVLASSVIHCPAQS